MKLSIGTLLASITLIISILIGGANFGEVRATVEENKIRIERIEESFSSMEEYIRDNNIMLATLVTDMEWVKKTKQ